MHQPPLSLLAALAVLPFVFAHGDEHDSMNMGGHAESGAAAPTSETPLSYFNHPEYKGWMYAHILLMIVGWTIILPISEYLTCGKWQWILLTDTCH